MKYHTLLPFVLGGLFLVGQGCSSPSQIDLSLPKPAEDAVVDTSIMEDAATKQEPAEDTAMPVSDSTYQEFSLAAYTRAQTAGKPIMLNFYANWCPTCREQEPRIIALFEMKKVPAGITAFRVNYNDSETDADEKTLAKELKVTYQHTHVYFDAQGNEIARTLGTTPDSKVLENLQKIAP